MTPGILDDARLHALLDTLLPGTHGFPPASQTAVPVHIAKADNQAELPRRALAALDPDFCRLGPVERVAAVARLESALGMTFQALVAAVYSAYYTDATVLAAMARTTGYQHPPQPSGYALPAFDATVLDTVRQAAPSWRDPLSHPEGNVP